MTKIKATFTYSISRSIPMGMPLVRRTLRDVRDQLLTHEINGGNKKLAMDTVCNADRKCGTAACIGGWVSLFLLGFEKAGDNEAMVVSNLFDHLIEMDPNLHNLFYDFDRTNDYDQPNVAATAINRYLRGNDKPWPRGKMPRVLKYTKPAKRR